MSSSITAASCFVSLIIAVEVNEAATAPVIIEKNKFENVCSWLKKVNKVILYKSYKPILSLYV